MAAVAGNTTIAVWNMLRFQISYLWRDITTTDSTISDGTICCHGQSRRDKPWKYMGM